MKDALDVLDFEIFEDFGFHFRRNFFENKTFENRDFLVILTHFVHLLGLLTRRIALLNPGEKRWEPVGLPMEN